MKKKLSLLVVAIMLMVTLIPLAVHAEEVSLFPENVEIDANCIEVTEVEHTLTQILLNQKLNTGMVNITDGYMK